MNGKDSPNALWNSKLALDGLTVPKSAQALGEAVPGRATRPAFDNLAASSHSEPMSKPALGRGLGALISGTATSPRPAPVPTSAPPVAAPAAPAPAPAPVDNLERVLRVPLTRIRPCPFQPRKDFAPEALKELADSIREQGIVQPLIVREQPDHLELIAGERRWRAAQIVGLSEVPVIVRIADDAAVLELALIENLQRENLNAIEEALGYAKLINDFKLTQEVVATKVGKSRAVVANALRLLRLPDEVQAFVRDGRVSVGHAKVILGLDSEELQKMAADRIIREGLNVRQTEVLVLGLETEKPATKGTTLKPIGKDTHVASLENRIRERVGTKVNLRYAKGKGSVQIAFFSDDDLERILQILGVKVD
jgi:ParB family chromosome partitioning protein